ncbi:MAG: T9SS type A sorting domain-containing protein [Prevotella sp.]|nr:T9SS type A sorting domain-containing protein [Prevotella sp.]
MLLAMFTNQTANAQRLVIWQKDGSKVNYNLDEQPKTTFTKDDLVITTATATISYPLAKIQRYTYEGGTLSVRDIKEDGVSISNSGDHIVVKGLTSGKTVIVYRVDGTQLLTQRSDSSDRMTISLSSLPAGVYIIKADEITYKFLKR